MRREANSAHGLTDREPKFDQRGGCNHEEKVGGTIYGRFADVPNDAMTAREMLGVAHDHRGIFKRRYGEVDKCERIIEDGE